MTVMPQTVSTDRYKLIPRTLIFIQRKDKVLLLKGSPDKRIWANLYNGIGGHIERGEDVLSAAQRELLEETSLESPDLYLCGTVTIDTNQDTGIGLFIFRGTCLDGEPIPSREGNLEWVPIQELMNFPLVEDLNELLPYTLKMEPFSPPFSAHYAYGKDGNLIITFGRTKR